MENNQAVFYDIVKICKGGLTLTLPAFDSTTPDRVITIPHDGKQARVPRAHALGIFINPTLERMYKEGRFKVEPMAQFEKEVAALFYPVTDKVEIIADDKIVEYLEKGNRVKIRELAAVEANRQRIVILARERIDTLSTGMVKDLETMLGVVLTVEDENE